ncbi:hypothetical protein GW17_00015844 [Ensete ventricosum]|nr:hypothetical protein GW17_00015844 [Ensete ventricosum]
MWWDLVESSLGDSPKEPGSSLGTRREIVGKKTGGLAARLPEVAGICGSESPVPQNLGGGQLLTACKPPGTTGFDLHPKKIGSECRCASRRRTRKWTYAVGAEPL